VAHPGGTVTLHTWRCPIANSTLRSFYRSLLQRPVPHSCGPARSTDPSADSLSYDSSVMSSRYTGLTCGCRLSAALTALCAVAGPGYDDPAMGCVCCAQFFPPSPNAAPLQATSLQHVIYVLGFECVFMHGFGLLSSYL
jgi:hypothetical protein